MDTESLSKVISAHFQRIQEVIPLMSGNDNCIITSSFDRSIKVWDLNYIFEEDHHIDKQELTIDNISVSTKAGIAATVTRFVLQLWKYLWNKIDLHILGAVLASGIS